MIWEGAQDDWTTAAPRPWQSARRLAAVVLGIVVGAEFAVLLWLVVAP